MEDLQSEIEREKVENLKGCEENDGFKQQKR